jgi:hypothetical protein
MHLAGPDSNSHQTYTSDERKSAENRGYWQGVLGFVGDLDRPEIDVFFLMGEGDASGGKSDDGQENEQSSDDGCWFHFDGDDLSCV